MPELSRRSGVPIRTIEDIERLNRGTCKLNTMIQLAIALDVTLDELAADDILNYKSSKGEP